MLLYMGTAAIRLLVYTTIFRRRETDVLVQMGHEYGDLAMLLSRSVLKVDGKEHLLSLPAGRRIFIVSNHESYLDIPCVLSISPYPIGFIAKKELGRIPLLGFWIKKTGGVLFNRTDMRAAKETLINTVSGQAVDRAILIFPEGTRNREGTVAPFKAGSIRIALDSDAVIVPVAMSGGRKKFEGNGWVVKKGDIKIKVLPPVDTRTAEANSKGQFAEFLRQIILKAHQELS
jgi:1-acyl-sn-glycerol-3-phosphate acyltransferase